MPDFRDKNPKHSIIQTSIPSHNNRIVYNTNPVLFKAIRNKPVFPRQQYSNTIAIIPDWSRKGQNSSSLRLTPWKNPLPVLKYSYLSENNRPLKPQPMPGAGERPKISLVYPYRNCLTQTRAYPFRGSFPRLYTPDKH